MSTPPQVRARNAPYVFSGRCRITVMNFPRHSIHPHSENNRSKCRDTSHGRSWRARQLVDRVRSQLRESHSSPVHPWGNGRRRPVRNSKLLAELRLL